MLPDDIFLLYKQRFFLDSPAHYWYSKQVLDLPLQAIVSIVNKIFPKQQAERITGA